MAPKRKKTVAGDASAVVTRVTRGSTRRAESATDSEAKTKKAKTAAPSEAPKPVSSEDEPASEADAGGARTIVVEHCKQCSSFKKRAEMAKSELEERVQGVTVVLNPEKPRRGCFEIREEGGEVFVSLLDMIRPFKPMKALDMEKLISDIVEKIK